MHWNFKNSLGNFDTNWCFDTTAHRWLLQHFLNTIGKWRFCITISNVVSCVCLHGLFYLFIRVFNFICSLFFRFPFDTKNPIGYFIAGICEYVAMITQAFVSMCIFCFAVGTTLLLISSAEDIKCALINLERSSKAKKNRSKIIMKQLLQLIELRSNAKQLNEFLFILSYLASQNFFLFFSLHLQIN